MVINTIFVIKIIISLIIALGTWYLTKQFNQKILKKYGINSFIKLTAFLIAYSLAAIAISITILGYSIFESFTINWSIILGIVFNWFIIFLQLLTIVILVKIFSGFAVLFIDNWSKKIRSTFKLKKLQIDLLKEIVKWSIYALGAVIILNILNLEGVATTVVASAGVVGVVAAFATQNVLQSFLAGAIVSLDKSFEKGDSVNINDVSGIVDKAKIRTTRIKTWEGPLVVIPNSKIMDANITNYSKNPYRRVHLTLDVIKSKKDEAIKLLEDELLKLPWVVEGMGSDILLDGYKTDFRSEIKMVTLSIRLWSKTDEYWGNVRSTFDLIDELMDKNNISYFNLQRV